MPSLGPGQQVAAQISKQKLWAANSQKGRVKNLAYYWREVADKNMPTTLCSLPEDVRILILMKTNDITLEIYGRVSPGCKIEGAIANAVAGKEAAAFISVHAIKKARLLKTVESIRGGWVSFNLELTKLRGEDRLHSMQHVGGVRSRQWMLV